MDNMPSCYKCRYWKRDIKQRPCCNCDKETKNKFKKRTILQRIILKIKGRIILWGRK